MKKLLILLMAFVFFTACNNNKGKTNPDNKSTNNRDKDDYRDNNKDNSDNKDKDNYDNTNNDDRNNDRNNDNNDPNPDNNSSGWSSADVREFVDNCVSAAEKKLDRSTAQSYCNCMQQKLARKYPDTRDVANLDMQSAEMKQMVKDCLPGY